MNRTPARANQWDDVFTLRRDTCNRHLCYRRSDLTSDRSQLFDQGEIGLQILALEARAHIAEVAFAGVRLRPVAADQAAGEHAISRDADP